MASRNFPGGPASRLHTPIAGAQIQSLVRELGAICLPLRPGADKQINIKKKEMASSTIDAFELWCWRRLLRVPWTARRSNQSILKEINPEYSLEGLIVKLKLQYFGHLI